MSSPRSSGVLPGERHRRPTGALEDPLHTAAVPADAAGEAHRRAPRHGGPAPDRQRAPDQGPHEHQVAVVRGRPRGGLPVHGAFDPVSQHLGDRHVYRVMDAEAVVPLAYPVPDDGLRLQRPGARHQAQPQQPGHDDPSPHPAPPADGYRLRSSVRGRYQSAATTPIGPWSTRRDAVPSRGAETLSRYLVAAVLSSADAQPSATARFGSAWPGKVAHPVFITNSVCSQDEVIAVSSPSFLTRATSTFCPARQIGTSAAVTAASACLTAIWPAVPPVVQPPQPNPTIIVSTPPMTAPQIPGFSHTGCTIMMSYLLAPRRIGESDPQCRRVAAGRVLDLGLLRCDAA